MWFKVGIDASRNRSGGAKAHLLGILKESDPRDHGISEVHVWSYKSLLNTLPDEPWLVKHNPPELERSLLHQVFWQYARLPKEAHRSGCNVLLNTDAGSVCSFRPGVVMSRDMLSYEPGEINRYGLTKARLRLILLRFIQNHSLRSADGAIFLTQYAARIIQNNTGRLRHVAVIPHGVDSAFKEITPIRDWPLAGERAIECLYVSNAAMYKHQWNVVKAIGNLRSRGLRLRLTLVGGGSGRALRLLNEEIRRTDPDSEFVNCMGFVSPKDLPHILADTNLFVFASSCENMPNTLLEAMAAGLPIACSNRGPMPEVLADGGIFFDPEKFTSIAQALEKLVLNSELRQRCAARARALAAQYSWARCGKETWEFLITTLKRRQYNANSFL